ncbi:type II toxin-antitoxin system VapB family antitoxin [Brevundimonas sp.]
MRTTVTIDDDLMEAAMEYSGVEEKSAVLRLALQAYVAREASRRLARMGGSQPDFEAAPRKRYFGVEEE